MFISEVTRIALLPLTMTWSPLRMCAARYWKEGLSMQWNTCRREVNEGTPSSVHADTHVHKEITSQTANVLIACL